MPREILLYGGVNNESAERFINTLNDVSEAGESEITVRVNSNGGSVEMLYGMAAKFREFEGTKNVKVDGAARSAGIFFLTYADNVEALDVSNFMVHRAAFPEWMEAIMSDEEKAVLVKINKDLRAAFESKVDVAAFEKATKTTLDEIFSLDDRIDVEIDSKTAKKIGLIDSVVKLTPKKRANLNASFEKIAAEYGTSVDLFEENSQISAEKDELSNNKNMTVEEIRANHPEAYNQIFAEGVKKEQARVSAWNKLADVDPVAVNAGIDSGEEITVEDSIKIMKAAAERSVVADAAEDNAEDTPTPDASEKESLEEPSESAQALDKLDKEVKSIRGIK